MDQRNEASTLIFKEDKHEYWLGGRQLLSVTTIMKRAGLIDDSWYTEESRIRGSAVHRAILYSIQNDLDRSSLHSIVEPYFFGWEKFLVEFDFKPVPELCEKPQHHPELLYAGTADVFGYSRGRPMLIDLKTGEPGTQAGYQTAAYAQFPAFKIHFPQRFALRLYPDKDKAPKLIRYNDPNDWEIFKSAFNTANLIKQKEIVLCQPLQ